MEFLILAMIAAVVVKRGAEDLIHAARGGTPQRYAAASARRKSGAAGRYWSLLWADAWDDLSARHTRKRDARDTRPRPVRDPSQMRTVFTQFGDDFGNWARATWRYGWNKLAAKQQARRLRRPPGRQTVPGTVVPNAQDEDEARPQDRPGPESRTVPTEGDEIDPRFSEDDTTLGPDSGPGQDITPPLDHTTEGTPTMTATATEVFSLDTALSWCDQSAQQYSAQAAASDRRAAGCRQTAEAYRAMANSTEHSIAALTGAGVTGPILVSLAGAQEKATMAAAAMDRAAAEYTAAQEQAGAAASEMEASAAELRTFKPGQEFYDSKPGAPDREFLTAGR